MNGWWGQVGWCGWGNELHLGYEDQGAEDGEMSFIWVMKVKGRC